MKLTLTLIYERRFLNEDCLWVRCKGWLVIIFRDNLIDDSLIILLEKIISLKTLQIKILVNTLQLILKKKVMTHGFFECEFLRLGGLLGKNIDFESTSKKMMDKQVWIMWRGIKESLDHILFHCDNVRKL